MFSYWDLKKIWKNNKQYLHGKGLLGVAKGTSICLPHVEMLRILTGFNKRRKAILLLLQSALQTHLYLCKPRRPTSSHATSHHQTEWNADWSWFTSCVKYTPLFYETKEIIFFSLLEIALWLMSHLLRELTPKNQKFENECERLQKFVGWSF